MNVTEVQDQAQIISPSNNIHICNVNSLDDVNITSMNEITNIDLRVLKILIAMILSILMVRY